MRKNKNKLVQTTCKFCESPSQAWLHMAEDAALMEVANAAVVVIDSWNSSAGRLGLSQTMSIAIDRLRASLEEFRGLDRSPELFQRMAEDLKELEHDLSTAVATDDH